MNGQYREEVILAYLNVVSELVGELKEIKKILSENNRHVAEIRRWRIPKASVRTVQKLLIESLTELIVSRYITKFLQTYLNMNFSSQFGLLNIFTDIANLFTKHLFTTTGIYLIKISINCPKVSPDAVIILKRKRHRLSYISWRWKEATNCTVRKEFKR
jgi:hypothetical protein